MLALTPGPSPGEGSSNLKKNKSNMALTDNERVQEIFLVAGDKISAVSKWWWIAFAAVLVLAIPVYYIIKASFVGIFTAGYDGPQITYTAQTKEPLQVLEKKIFSLPNNTYSGYIKIRNVNLEWGVAEQKYTAEFKTYGGTLITKVAGSTYILPASEKLIVFTRFTADKAPEEILVTLDESRFIHKPEISIDLESQRTNVKNNPDGLVVSSAVKNFSAFTIKQINLPVAVYDNKNNVVAVNFTYINDVKSGETRTFQYTWPTSIPGAVRAEVIPEVNIFDRDILDTEPETNPINGR